jgi:myo-inositol-1(or 4)-monophosphatase
VSSYAQLVPDFESICRSAIDVALKSRSQGIKRELKPDGSLVTQVDKEVELFFREKLEVLLPGSSIWGEEFGQPEKMTDELWVIDPIDGTSNFAFGSPIWGITVALTTPEHVEFGVIALPDLNEFYTATRGNGSFCNGQRIAPIQAGPIRPEELLSYNETVLRTHIEQPIPGKMRCSGAVVVDATFTAMQRYRGFIGMSEKLYDDAAGMLIAQEANADVRYADGRPIDLRQLRDGKKLDPWLIFPKDSGFKLIR